MNDPSKPVATQLQALPEMLTANDLARLIQTTTRSVRRFVLRGVLPPPQRFGRLMRWSRQDIAKILTAHVSRN